MKNSLKKFLGIILCIYAFIFGVVGEPVEKSAKPLFIVLAFLCIVGAVLLFKSSKKTQKSETHTTMAEGEFVTVQTTYTPSAVPNNVAKEMRKYYTLMQAQRDAEILTDSYHLASTTVNLETFCSRYDLAMQKAHTLLQAEQVGVRGIKKLNCHDACQRVISSADALKVRVLHDFEKEELRKADALKTNRGKLNRYIKMLTALEKAEPTFMFMAEYDDLIERVKDLIADMGGAER